MKIVLDLDGVVANFTLGLMSWLNKNHGTTFNVREDPKVYSIPHWGHGIDKIFLEAAIRDWILEDGYLRLEKEPGCQCLLHELRNHEVTIATARSDLLPSVQAKIERDTHLWLTREQVPYQRVIFTQDKTSVCQKYSAEFLIEDYAVAALGASKAGFDVLLRMKEYSKGLVLVTDGAGIIRRCNDYYSIVKALRGA
jgi:uncharacterized HAD superfamily protein